MRFHQIFHSARLNFTRNSTLLSLKNYSILNVLKEPQLGEKIEMKVIFKSAMFNFTPDAQNCEKFIKYAK